MKKLKVKPVEVIWVCHYCGTKYGEITPNHVATYHLDTCDICGTENVSVTEPRDYNINCTFVEVVK